MPNIIVAINDRNGITVERIMVPVTLNPPYSSLLALVDDAVGTGAIEEIGFKPPSRPLLSLMDDVAEADMIRAVRFKALSPLLLSLIDDTVEAETTREVGLVLVFVCK